MQFKPGNFYMHEKSMDACVRVLEDIGSGTYEVTWWNIGFVGTPWPITSEPQRIYMHPDVWTDITAKINLPREQWTS
jgi:hypothetical protein